jgi:hypothetical protein
VTAPSNSASDLFIQRLDATNQFNPQRMIRFNAISRDAASIPAEVKLYAQSLELVTDWLDIPESAESVQIVVTTCVTAGSLFGLGLPAEFFTHIFVDEAGHADEPESLIPIVGLASETTKIVLGGDPKQLGPVIASSIAKQYGLGISLLERLVNNCPAYEKSEEFKEFSQYNPVYITKLLLNYRYEHDKVFNRFLLVAPLTILIGRGAILGHIQPF